jgi:hypothetical protein
MANDADLWSLTSRHPPADPALNQPEFSVHDRQPIVRKPVVRPGSKPKLPGSEACPIPSGCSPPIPGPEGLTHTPLDSIFDIDIHNLFDIMNP